MHPLYLLLMKRRSYIICLLIFAACAAEETENTVPFYAPPKGTVIDADSIPVVEDELNEFYYSVILTSKENSNEGKYILDAAFGPNKARTEIVYPDLGQQIVPELQLDKTSPYSYHVGFHYNDDNTFHEYAKIFAKKNEFGVRQIQLKYVKAYYMEDASKTK